jgi:prepilin-type N-terminal cleavage/methylation domain-containing protein
MDNRITISRIQRPGFTLVEMLVVLSIVVILAAFTALFMPRFAERERAAKGADQLQGWLLIARQWALRDRVPTGVRLQIDPQSPPNQTYVRTLQYIQKPEDFAKGYIKPIALAVNRYPFVDLDPTTGMEVNTVDFFGAATGLGQGEAMLVQPGDYFQLRRDGPVHRIDQVQPNNLLLASTPHFGTPPLPRYSYRILRQPRLLAGEQPLQLPDQVAIDLSRFDPTNPMSPTRSQNVPSRQEYLEILFSPGGSVIGQGSATRPIILWVRDVSKDLSAPGLQTLIAIYPSSGLIAAHSVSADPSDPWKLARDGRSSGL